MRGRKSRLRGMPLVPSAAGRGDRLKRMAPLAQGWPHWLRGGTIGQTGGNLDPFTAQVNPIGGGLGRPPTLPPIGPSCAGTG